MLKRLIFTALFLPMAVWAQGPSVFEETIKKYQQAKLISMDVDKTVKSELLERTTNYKGEIKLSKGKFRWANETPEKTLLLFDGKTLLNVQFPSEDFGGPVQVAKSKINKKSKKQILIAALLSPSQAKSKFKVLTARTLEDGVEFTVSPEGEDLMVKELVMKIEPKNKTIKEISYKDDVGNLTKLVFEDIKFLSKADPAIFKYKIPKGAQVTEL